MLLLDTHVWMWSMESDTRRIGRQSQRLLQRAQNRDAIRLSPVSLFELGALHTLGRVRLSRPLDQWFRESLEAPGLHIAELTPTIAMDAGRIHRASLADPLDRILVATARQLEATFLTADTAILAHAAKAGDVRVHDARL